VDPGRERRDGRRCVMDVGRADADGVELFAGQHLSVVAVGLLDPVLLRGLAQGFAVVIAKGGELDPRDFLVAGDMGVLGDASGADDTDPHCLHLHPPVVMIPGPAQSPARHISLARLRAQRCAPLRERSTIRRAPAPAFSTLT